MARKKRFDPVAETQADAGRVLGVSTRTFRTWLEEGAPGKQAKFGGYVIRLLIEWAVENGKWRNQPTSNGQPAAPTEPAALDRLRETELRLKELDYQERLGELVNVVAMQEFLQELSAMLRDAGEKFQRQFGPDALALLDETLQEFDRKLGDEFGDRRTAEQQKHR